MAPRVALIGFGEASRAFGGGAPARRQAYDRKSDAAATRAAMAGAYRDTGVIGCATVAAALDGAEAVLSLVTADQALDAARAVADSIDAGALFLDGNSVAPATKRAAATAIEAAGGRYVDVAIMAPVLPGRCGVPLLVGGPHADAGAVMLATLGFTRVSVIDGPVGAASSIKMIRSVMVKGIEALSAECALAAEAAGVLDAVVASLDASWPGAEWGSRFDYNLDRMMVHGLRRAAEMEQVVDTLDSLGTGASMTRGTIERQRAIGGLGIAPPQGLDAKLAALRPREDREAA